MNSTLENMLIEANQNSFSVLQVLLIAALWYLTGRLITKLWNYITGTLYLHLLERGDWTGANNLITTTGNSIIMPSPAFFALRGGDDKFETGILEFSHAYTCGMNDEKYNGGFDPKMFVIALTPDQAGSLSYALDTFIELNKEGSKDVKVSRDGKIIDLTNRFKKNEDKV